MADRMRLYTGTDHGLSVWHPSARGWEEAGRLDVDKPVRTMRGSASHPERVFVGLYSDGVYRTDDAGAHWVKVFDHDYVRAVAIDPDNDDVVYAGTEPVHLYRSEDRGEHWEELHSLQDFPDEIKVRWRSPAALGRGHVRDIFIQPADPRTIYLSLEHGGIVRTFDGGATWEDVSSGIDYLDIHMVASLPGRVDRYYAATARGFFASDDPGDGWVRAEDGFTRDYFHDFIFLPPVREGDNPTMLIATADKSPGSWNRPEGARGALFRSLDCAESWQRVGAGLAESMEENVWAIAAHPGDRPSALIGLGRAFRDGTDDGPGTLLVTSDRGDTWQPLSMEMPAVRALWATPE